MLNNALKRTVLKSDKNPISPKLFLPTYRFQASIFNLNRRVVFNPSVVLYSEGGSTNFFRVISYPPIYFFHPGGLYSPSKPSRIYAFASPPPNISL